MTTTTTTFDVPPPIGADTPARALLEAADELDGWTR